MRAARRRVHTDDPYTPAHRAKAVAMAGPLGLVAGAFGSVVGVGGGVLIVPAITAAVPIPQRVVTGTSLIAVLSTAAVSTYNFSHAGLVDPTAAAIIGGAAMLSAPFGARLTTTAGLRPTQTSPRVLSAVRSAVGAAQGGGVSPPRR
jgi:uncharacterized membrane protein YfcA